MSSVISTRHIRHDWQTWIDWEQKSVRSLCNVTTKRHLAGIPGITEQPQIVVVGDKKLWGWCAPCVVKAINVIESVDNASTDQRVDSLYDSAYRDLEGQFLWMQSRGLLYRPRVAQDASNV